MSRVHDADIDLELPTAETDDADLEQGSIFFVGTATVILEYAGFTVPTDPNFLHSGDHVHLGYGSPPGGGPTRPSKSRSRRSSGSTSRATRWSPTPSRKFPNATPRSTSRSCIWAGRGSWACS